MKILIKKFIIILNANIVFTKNLYVEEDQTILPKQSTHLKSTTKKYYINEATEWLYARCNHHVKTKEKAAIWGFYIQYPHIENGIINESRIR